MPLFGAVHLSLLAAILGAAFVLVWLCRQGKLAPRPVRLVLGYGIAVNELIWWVFRYSHEGIHWANLPLQLCDISVWASVLGCLTLIPALVEFVYFAGVAGAGMALLTPDLWRPWPSYPAIYFFLAHGGVVIAAIVLPFGKLGSVKKGAMWRSFGILALYATGVGLFNALTGANYMYLRRKPSNPSLLDWLGPWPVYLVGALVLALLFFWLLSIPLRAWARMSSPEA